ncbi:MAG: hypothetical protein WC753_00895 [Candidatus Gracilibacteria bacterium]
MSTQYKTQPGSLPDGTINIDSGKAGPEVETLQLGIGDRVQMITAQDKGKEISAIGETEFDTFFQSLAPIIEKAKKEAIEGEKEIKCRIPKKMLEELAGKLEGNCIGINDFHPLLESSLKKKGIKLDDLYPKEFLTRVVKTIFGSGTTRMMLGSDYTVVFSPE